MPTTLPPSHRVVKWVKDDFGNSEPLWSSEPSIPLLETLARKHLAIAAEASCVVSFFAQGAFNKLYTVDAPGHTYLIRVALPVEPRLKTLSEVATIDFVRTHATELVPRVLAYDADVVVTEEGGLGFEWMIMEKIPGDVLENRWDDMDWESKVVLVKTLAGVLAKLYDNPLSGIGNLYPPSDSANTIGRIVSMMFFWDDHLDQDVPRGPFRSSHDWLAAHLTFIINDSTAVLNRTTTKDDDAEDDEDEEDEREEAEETQAVAERLISLLPRVFPPSSPDDGPSVIHHDDISFHNLLVDDSGRLAGILDWECVPALPRWRACTLPSFLQGRSRTEQPQIEGYSKAENGKPDTAYFEHVRQWEKTQLRQVFVSEMRQLRPEWVHTYRTSGLKNDFYTAVLLCNDFRRGWVRDWLDRVEVMDDQELRGESGEGYKSLEDDLMK